jgi:hypothetical protein
LANILVFATALSLVITIVFFGFKIIVHGSHMCQVLIENNLLNRLLYTSCGCALVEVILLGVSLVTLRFSTPRLLNDYRLFWSLRRKPRS